MISIVFFEGSGIIIRIEFKFRAVMHKLVLVLFSEDGGNQPSANVYVAQCVISGIANNDITSA